MGKFMRQAVCAGRNPGVVWFARTGLITVVGDSVWVLVGVAVGEKIPLVLVITQAVLNIGLALTALGWISLCACCGGIFGFHSFTCNAWKNRELSGDRDPHYVARRPISRGD